MQDLVVALDDADGRILYAQFVPQEGTASTFAGHLSRMLCLRLLITASSSAPAFASSRGSAADSLRQAPAFPVGCATRLWA